MMNIVQIIFVISLVLFISFFIVGLLLLIYTIKLRIYLKRNNHDHWINISTICGVSGGANPIQLIKYVFGNIDNQDQPIGGIKKKLRLLFKLGATIFVFIIILIFFVYITTYLCFDF